ncbi:hypothetical protein [Crenobacter intestini]|uniref:Uncharacterized protein n=1 Tax=Crenobacter intestini TaxID=2563443 RepID=A0A4T0UNM3_9NEIS|nr:hypothetical protein [Crenobacter intestini]TIC80308.1 hypothetical protein E5K04_12440 [Crenobacter intestini]
MPVLKSAPLAQEFFSFNPGQLFAELALSATARGASKIRIHTTEDGFFLSNDGEPIPDLASLFQSAEQADTLLLALLACCRRVRIVSGTQQMDVLSRDAVVQNVFARPAEVRCEDRIISLS